MKYISLAFSILITSSVFLACGNKETTEKKVSDTFIDDEIYALNDSNWVQLDYNLFDSSFADSVRLLSAGEMSLTEAIIFEYIKIEAPDIYKKRKLYNRQYFCGLKNKQILIYINYFVDETGRYKNWKSEYIHVLDGGDNYFQIKLNWSEMKCYDLSINGDA